MFVWTRIKLLSILFSSILILSITAPVLADSGTTATATINGAFSVTETAPTNVNFSTTLNGADLTPNYTIPLDVQDLTGNGNGWNLTVTSTQFSTGGNTPHTLAADASTITAVHATCATTGTCTNPSPTAAFNYDGSTVALPAGSSAPTSIKFYNAQAGSGLGKFTVTPTIQVAIPANAYAGTYSSTIFIAIVSGP